VIAAAVARGAVGGAVDAAVHPDAAARATATSVAADAAAVRRRKRPQRVLARTGQKRNESEEEDGSPHLKTRAPFYGPAHRRSRRISALPVTVV
jgi:hypothetical protein